ncbi:MAG: PAS domain S-box protein, partial [Dehalococcoidia bacterium]
AFTRYEALINEAIRKHRMIAICSYLLKKSEVPEARAIINNHDFALAKRHSTWNIHNGVIQKAGTLAPAGQRQQIERRYLRRQSDIIAKQYGERYLDLLNRSTDMVYLHDFDGNILDANDAALTALGYAPGEISSQNITSFIDSDQLPRALNILRELKKTGQQKDPAEFTIRCKDGRCLDVETMGVVIHHDGKPHAVQCIARNLALQKRIGLEELRAEKLDSIGVLAGGIAHDFNNILTGILGNIDIAMSDVKPGSRASSRLKSAENACLRAKGLTQQLLTFARGGYPSRRPYLTQNCSGKQSNLFIWARMPGVNL